MPRFKICYTKGAELKKTIVEAPDVGEAMKRGYRETKWDSVMEVTTDDDKALHLPH